MKSDVINNQKIRVYDSPKYGDRYTIVLMEMKEPNGLYTCIGMNDTPYHPAFGICQT